MFLDGLEDAYDKGRLMGTFAEDCATKYAFTREAQDEFALASLSRALAANNDGTFAWEIAPVTVQGRKGDVVIDKDEQPAKAKPEKIPTLQAGVPQGRHGDRGELELDLRRRRGAGADAPLAAPKKRGLKPLARDRRRTRRTRRSRRGSRPRRSARSTKLLKKTGWTASDVDLFEINEAFAVVTMAAMKEHELAARQGQRARRRLRARPSDRRFRRAHPRDADRRAAQARQASAASRRCASAAAKRRRWRSSSLEARASCAPRQGAVPATLRLSRGRGRPA